MKSTPAAAMLTLAVLLAACEAPTDPAPTSDASPSLAAGASGATTDIDPADYDANGNGVVCVKTVPASGKASPQAGERTIVKDDDGDGNCPGGFEATELRFNTTVAAGFRHACALDSTGAAWCWGDNSRGQLGDGNLSVAFRETPAPVVGGHSFVSLDGGDQHLCAIDGSAALYCWGSNGNGALGTSATTETCTVVACSSTPIPAASGLLFASVDAGLLATCAIATDGVAYCWGWDVFNQGGDGVVSTGPTPTPIATPPALVAVTSGAAGGCGLDAASAAYCWSTFTLSGLADGWLGNGTYAGSSTPTAVAGGHLFESVVSADGNDIFWFQCGIDDAAAAWCWGANRLGQLGTTALMDACTPFMGMPVPCINVPTAVDGGYRWAELDLGREFACGRTTSDEILCWGDNEAGNLGDGTKTNSPVPVSVAFGAPSPAPAASSAPSSAANAISGADTRIIRN